MFSKPLERRDALVARRRKLHTQVKTISVIALILFLRCPHSLLEREEATGWLERWPLLQKKNLKMHTQSSEIKQRNKGNWTSRSGIARLEMGSEENARSYQERDCIKAWLAEHYKAGLLPSCKYLALTETLEPFNPHKPPPLQRTKTCILFHGTCVILKCSRHRNVPDGRPRWFVKNDGTSAGAILMLHWLRLQAASVLNKYTHPHAMRMSCMLHTHTQTHTIVRMSFNERTHTPAPVDMYNWKIHSS